jgi:UDP-glucose 4-epimerase
LSHEYFIYSLGRTEIENVDKHIICDLSQTIDLNILPENVNVVLYLAQSNNYKDFDSFSHEIFSINTIRPFELAEYYKTKNISQFIYASSGGIYDSSIGFHHEEETIKDIKGKNPYFKSKYSAEIILNSYSLFMKMVMLRPFFMFGRNQKEDMLITRLINNIKKNKVIQIQGSEGIKLNPIYVYDAAGILKNIITNELSGVYNIAGKEPLSLKRLCLKIGEKLNVSPTFEFTDEVENNILGDISKTGFIEYTELDSSIERLF